MGRLERQSRPADKDSEEAICFAEVAGELRRRQSEAVVDLPRYHHTQISLSQLIIGNHYPNYKNCACSPTAADYILLDLVITTWLCLLTPQDHRSRPRWHYVKARI